VIWYKFYLGDYIIHTNHLSDAHDLAYRRLLDMYYMTEKPIPLESESVAKRIRLDRDIVEDVLNEFFDREDDGYHNGRCDIEIAKYQRQVAINRDLGNRPKKKKDIEKQELKIVQSESLTESKAIAKPNQIQIQNINTISSSFDDFWREWPASKRKVAKSTCQNKWGKMKLDAVADQILNHIGVMKKSEQWTSGYEPAPLTYLNQRRWEDGTDCGASGAFFGRKAI
jgi:uncharacterized protein YdaU (DUF1376 family)